MTALTDDARALSFRIRRRIVDASLQVPLSPPSITALFGPSGAGKSTILRCIAGLERVDHGRISLDGVILDDGRTRVRPQHRRVGYMFQDLALFPHLTVAQNVSYGLTHVPRDERPERVAEALRSAGLPGFQTRHIRELSGGEAQRVALARTLAPRPSILLLDEPLSALDTPTRLSLRSELRALVREAGIPTVLVTHDRDEAHFLADRVAVLIEGGVRQLGTPDDVFNRPIDTAVAAAVGMENSFQATVARTETGTVHLTAGPLDLFATEVGSRDLFAAGEVVYSCVRAGDIGIVSAETSDRARPAAGNRIDATITGIAEESSVIRIALDAGIPLVAYMTRLGYAGQNLRMGSAVIAEIAPSAIHVVGR